jgi:hypothetical protein
MSAPVTPRIRMRFLHTSWRHASEGFPPLECAVTRIARGEVYYRGIYCHGDRESLGDAMRCRVEDFGRYCGKITT